MSKTKFDRMTANDLPLSARAFLKSQGLSDAPIEPLTSDASTRRYFRISTASCLLMDDSQNAESFAAYQQLSRHLNALGLSAPKIVAADAESGLALVEDFGSSTYANCLASGADETALYKLAVDALLHLHAAQNAKDIQRPRYTSDRSLREVGLFVDWFAAQFIEEGALPTFRADFIRLWEQALRFLDDAPRTLILRDFHIDNLMLLDDRAGVARCGLLDFQDAVLGPAEYDLVSLLQDARRDLSPGLETQMMEHYMAAASLTDDAIERFQQRYHVLGAQRHARIAGVFVRLCKRDRKPGYLRFLPRVLSQLEQALKDADLVNILELLNTSMPGWKEIGSELTSALLSK